MTTKTAIPGFGIRGLAVAAIGLLAAATTAQAQSTPLVCSVTKTMECNAASGCDRYKGLVPHATSLHVNAGAGVITILAPESRRGETTQIGSVDSLAERLVLSGVEDRRGWSMLIDRMDGTMSLTISGDHVGWVLFGDCLTEDKLKP